MDNAKISVIILNYNGLKFIKGCLNSVLKTNYPNFEVILVDNASKDRSLKIAEKFFGKNSHLKIVRNKTNLGFAEGNNTGTKHAKGDTLVFLNVDTEVDPNWLRELINLMNSDPTIGAAQCKLLIAQNRRKLESIGHYVDYTGIESAQSALIKGQTDNGQYDQIREIFYARGAAMAVRKTAFFEAGMFDPAYFIDHEEIDLCWRIRLRGYRIVFAPKSIVYHYGSAIAGGREENPFMLFHLRKNHITSLLKNYELRNTLKYLPAYLTFLLGHAAFSTLKKKKAVAIAYLKALLWTLTNLKYIYSQRLKVQRLIRRVHDPEVMKHMTPLRIPWHFLK